MAYLLAWYAFSRLRLVISLFLRALFREVSPTMVPDLSPANFDNVEDALSKNRITRSLFGALVFGVSAFFGCAAGAVVFGVSAFFGAGAVLPWASFLDSILVKTFFDTVTTRLPLLECLLFTPHDFDPECESKRLAFASEPWPALVAFLIVLPLPLASPGEEGLCAAPALVALAFTIFDPEVPTLATAAL